jgi:hypothetical protein
MTKNSEVLFSMIFSAILAKFEDTIPTIEQLYEEAENIRQSCCSYCPVTDAEFEYVIKSLRESVLVTIGSPHTLKGIDATHQSWYLMTHNDGFFWNRYRKYLEKKETWNKDVVRRLHETTNGIMDDLGDPTDQTKTFTRRGLLLGDVQSGKTATYTAICNKAADSGYKVIIVLAGLLENLRFQTQERLDAEFAGRESKYTLDTKADIKIKNMSVGVGKIGPFNPEKRISCFTSVSTDFSKSVVMSNDLTLRNLKGTALFVVKKNKSVLNNLYKWLVENNAMDNGKIEMSLLLIDDEADNASVNTKNDEYNPTAINDAIRRILDSFTQSSYLGITATPFANIFIDPNTPDGMPDDLFPRHFLTVLPSPSTYIGAENIFGNGDDDDGHVRHDAKYSNSLIRLYSSEMDGYFKFKHKKTLADELYDLPGSLEEALAYFFLVTAVRDKRGDNNKHCSMMINVSRFTDVQNVLVEIIEKWVKDVRCDIEDYGRLSTDDALKIHNIQYLKAIWAKYNFESLAQCSWEVVLHEFLFDAVRRIEIRAVNQSTGSASLNYYAYKNTGFRVIAVGGNSLSRGLTLEGLCVSYFYRNTMMYDTLLQMGRWFGYRPNYEDLFKIWISEEAVDWYGYITDATIELKTELIRMEKQNQTPEEFGLKVRQDPNSLIVTARNKMRTGTIVSRPITVSGRLIETPRLKNRRESLENNERLCRKLIHELDGIEGVTRILNESPKAILWRHVPKNYIVDIVHNFDSHPWHLNFQPLALSEYIDRDEDGLLETWDIAVPFGSFEDMNNPYNLEGYSEKFTIKPEWHAIKEDSSMLRVSGTHVKVGAGTSTRIGLSESEITRIKQLIKLKNKGKKNDEEEEKITDSTYLKYGQKDDGSTRYPILMIHIVKTKAEEGGDPLIKCPEYIYALGLGFPHTGRMERTANYVVNLNELKNWVDIGDEDEEDDDT